MFSNSIGVNLNVEVWLSTYRRMLFLHSEQTYRGTGYHHQNPLVAHYIEAELTEDSAVELAHCVAAVVVAEADPNCLAAGC